MKQTAWENLMAKEYSKEETLDQIKRKKEEKFMVSRMDKMQKEELVQKKKEEDEF